MIVIDIPKEAVALKALGSSWTNTPSNWVGFDPCGGGWVGIECTNSRVTSIILTSMNLTGQLSGDIGSLSELQTLDLSSNNLMTGPLPQAIGNLRNLSFLCLTGCGFSGPIPYTIGSLQQLRNLALNSNKFSGPIPNSIGNLSNLLYLDLTDNELSGSIPVSSGTTPGLDMLLQTSHFHLGKNKLSGTVPPQLFSSNMNLIHVLFDNNNLSGIIPSTLGLVQTLEVVRLDRNSLSGPVPPNISSLANLIELSLSNNNLTGPMPNLTGMNLLYNLDMSNNSFDISDVPPWITSLQYLTTLMMEHTQLEGPIPANLLSLPNLEIVGLTNNHLNGTLNIGTTHTSLLQRIDLRNNSIIKITGGNNITILLEGNPVCENTDQVTEIYCNVSTSSSSNLIPQNNCLQIYCNSDQVASPNCKCAYPYKGTLFFRALSSLDLGNLTYYFAPEESLNQNLKSYELPVDSVSLSNPTIDSFGYLELSLEVFPSGEDRFNETGITMIGYVLNKMSFNPTRLFGPYFLIADTSDYHAGSNKGRSSGIIIGAAVGGSVLLSLLVLAGVYAFHQKKRAERAIEQNNPFANWDLNMGSSSVAPQLTGARLFSFDELKKYTNNFSEANGIGSGGYGKVYRGTLSTGQLIAIKRAQRDSMQGGHEFKTEIELLSRVHHKNLVTLVGFCFEQAEQMLVYEYIPNGTLMDSLSGKSGIRLNWMSRLRVAVGAARGLVYLHEHANPPIIHRDIKSNNILLDESLNAKVADFGLSKPMTFDSRRNYVSTQVKGTMGYMDPEYYMTQQLTEKSDVYSFGVLLLELITARRPIERGKYIVRLVRNAMDKTKELYNLNEILDPTIGSGTTPKGLERFVDLAMWCVEESGAQRPTMGEVVKEIETIMQLSGLNPNSESASSSATYEEAGKGRSHHPYSDDDFYYSESFPPSRLIEPT
ncbi:leucine-rich repeat receptor protein kinase HPCA1-like isoform X2 [Alnus glutinosa]|uniref:leucine-rich repeat receptor protein kinase HPCA1-like isoform X2 n=1 Tax=Alnus glutinosa TaxID=3517 RepID=UPI002D7766AE|nr:leucine-rich repeat receptor protein kinase HPCA1-like isoform X2 [Alnus glutinosa]